MPLYEYECAECGERFEIIQKFSDEALRVHSAAAGASCGGPVRKLLSVPAIQFKGSGWYVTDYGKGGKKPPKEQGEASAKKESKASGGKGASGDSGKSAAKAATSKAGKAAA